MENKINIKGMHCAACKQLITMELEDAGFAKNINSLELGDNNIGVLALTDTDYVQLGKIKSVINNMDSYSVI